MVQVYYVCFFLDGRGMVLVSITNCCLDSFPVWVIDQYSLNLINGYEFRDYRRWRKRNIHQEFVQVKIVFLQNVIVDDGCGI